MRKKLIAGGTSSNATRNIQVFGGSARPLSDRKADDTRRRGRMIPMLGRVFLALAIFCPLVNGAPPEHPRILLTPSVRALLKTKEASRDHIWRAVKSSADSLLDNRVIPYQRKGCAENAICYDYQGFGWLYAIQDLGIAYQITGDPRYADQVMAIMDAANAPYRDTGSVEPVSVDSGYPTRTAALGLALAFDWVYDRLDARRKAETINTLNAWFDWLRTGRGIMDKRGPAYGNYFGGHLLGFGAAGYATAGDNPRATEIQDYVLGLFNANVVEAFSSGGFAGGYPVESYGYGPNHFARLVQYMQIVEENTGRDIGLVPYGKQMAKNLLYNLKPNRWQATDEGDFPGDYTGIMKGTLPVLLSSVLDGTTEGKWMQWFYTHLAKPPYGTDTTPSTFDRLLYEDLARESLDYGTTEPTSYRSPGDEHIYVRSDWTDGAVWASFAAGTARWTGHESKKAGHIAVQRGNDYLLVNSGQWKGESGVTGRPQAFDLASWRTNTLYASDSGEYLYTRNRYIGGQTGSGTNDVLFYDTGSHHVYAKADLTTAYDLAPQYRNEDARSVRSFIRSFVFLGDKYFVVWDRVKMLKPTHTKKLFWHFSPAGGVPTVDGTLAQSTIGSSTLFLKTLLPDSPAINVVADGARNFSDQRPLTYRVEISDSVPHTDLGALQVIEAAPKGEAFPETTTVEVGGGNMVGALVADAIPRIVLFSKDGTPQSIVTYKASYSGTGRHLIVDLVPGDYAIQRDSEDVFQMLSTTASGVLSFETTSGTSFSVIRQ